MSKDDKKDDRKDDRKGEEFRQSEKPIGQKYEASKSRKYLVTNRRNEPYDFKLGKKFFQRLEPRGKLGDQCEIPASYISHPDFSSHSKYIVIQEK